MLILIFGARVVLPVCVHPAQCPRCKQLMYVAFDVVTGNLVYATLLLAECLFEDVHMDNSSFIKLRQSHTPQSECHGHMHRVEGKSYCQVAGKFL